MKEFIFDIYKHCINPNRIPIGNKDFYLEILTACSNGKWYHGSWYWTKNDSFSNGVYIDSYPCSTEEEAIMRESVLVSGWLSKSTKRSKLEVPLSIFKELKDTYHKYKTPQMTLF